MQSISVLRCRATAGHAVWQLLPGMLSDAVAQGCQQGESFDINNNSAHLPPTVIGMLAPRPPPPEPEELSDAPEVAVEAPAHA